jgi:hypothetical protein
LFVPIVDDFGDSLARVIWTTVITALIIGVLVGVFVVWAVPRIASHVVLR